MSEAPEQPKRIRRLFAFGEHPDTPAEPSDAPLLPLVLRFVSGEDVPLTPELATLLKREFAAQENFRSLLYQRMVAIVQELRATSATVIQGHEVPFCVHEEYARGYGMGSYDGSTHAAELVAHALNEAMEEMEGPLT